MSGGALPGAKKKVRRAPFGAKKKRVRSRPTWWTESEALVWIATRDVRIVEKTHARPFDTRKCPTGDDAAKVALVAVALATVYPIPGRPRPESVGEAIAVAVQELSDALSASQIQRAPQGFDSQAIQRIWAAERGRARVWTFDGAAVERLAARLINRPRSAYTEPRARGGLDFGACRIKLLKELEPDGKHEEPRRVAALFTAAINSCLLRLDAPSPRRGVSVFGNFRGSPEDRERMLTNVKTWTQGGRPRQKKATP